MSECHEHTIYIDEARDRPWRCKALKDGRVCGSIVMTGRLTLGTTIRMRCPSCGAENAFTVRVTHKLVVAGVEV